MKIEQQVVSLDLARRLKDLGVPQESAFYWDAEKTNFLVPNKIMWFAEDCGQGNFISAFTVAELIELVANCSNEYAIGYDDSGCFWRFQRGERGCGSMMEGFGDSWSSDDEGTLADALAAWLIHLLEHKIIKP